VKIRIFILLFQLFFHIIMFTYPSAYIRYIPSYGPTCNGESL